MIVPCGEKKTLPKPPWLKRTIPSGATYQEVRSLLKTQGLHTVCEEAACPNLGECFSRGTATFLILGDRCTRNCGFCAVSQGPEGPPDPREPQRVAQAARALALHYVVITSVTRDDLPDGGAERFANTIEAVHEKNTGALVEVLIPDFQGNHRALERILRARPNVLNHNMETVPRLYRRVRPQADYQRSLDVLQWAKNDGLRTKSGIMVGLGEEEDEVVALMEDFVEIGLDVMTIGQYMQPTKMHLPVEDWVEPETFAWYKEVGEAKGIEHVESSPLTRSSYHAEKHV